jgi:hypothetical protein
MKVGQPSENKRSGRRVKADAEELLRYEGLWVDTFVGMRDGSPEIVEKMPVGSRMFIKASGQPRQWTQITTPDHPPRIKRQPKFSDTPAELNQWRQQVLAEEERFEQMAYQMETYAFPAIPHEQHLWEALKRARTGTQVRKIFTLSKEWLKTRAEGPNGGFVAWWYWRIVLYREADKFAKAKNDPRYPMRDSRLSGDYRRVEYFARVMAGLTLRIAPSTSVEILRKFKHPEECYCWRCLRGIAPKYPTSLARYLAEGRWFEQP